MKSGTQSKSTVEVAAGLVFRAGQLLVTQRRATEHLGGLWEFPGGKREAGESFEACLRRELSEELGIEVVVESLIQEVTHAYPEKTVRIQFFRCRWLRHEPQPLGCAACRWIRREQLADFAFPAADENLLAELATARELWGS